MRRRNELSIRGPNCLGRQHANPTDRLQIASNSCELRRRTHKRTANSPLRAKFEFAAPTNLTPPRARNMGSLSPPWDEEHRHRAYIRSLARLVASFKKRPFPRSRRPLCGARCRSRGAERCRAKVCLKPNGQLARRCRMHGGLSTGPTTAEGRERCRIAGRLGALRRWRRDGTS